MDPISMQSMMFSNPMKIADEMGRGGAVGNGNGSVKLPTDELKKLQDSVMTPALPGASPIHSFGNGGDSFSAVLGNVVKEVNAKQAVAGNAVEGLLSGQEVPLHKAMLAVEEASVSFQLMVEVRNKLLESYQELMRMQI